MSAIRLSQRLTPEALCAIHNIELDRFAFLQRFETIPFERRIMDKDILSGFEPNETKPLSIIEPFDSSFGFHPALLFVRHSRQCSGLGSARLQNKNLGISCAVSSRRSIYHSL